MTVLEYVLDGLEAALELERELGVRTVECDRALLAPPETAAPAPPPPRPASASSSPPRPGPEAQAKARSGAEKALDFFFVHDRPLSPEGGEMMAKIVAALGRTAESAPVVCATPFPKARLCVVLGGLALKKFFPGVRGEPGAWVKSPGGRDMLVTYSPEYILRFGAVTPGVRKLKSAMWRDLKAVRQRAEA